MNRFRIAFALAAAGVGVAACGRSPSAPSVLSLAGNWSGPGANMLGRHTISLAITQSGTALSGTVQTRAADPNDGTCSSCHMNKLGTFTGTIAGTAVSLTMTFPAGNQSEPTPICSATMSINTTDVTPSRIAGIYSGGDTCEGPWLETSVTITRQ